MLTENGLPGAQLLHRAWAEVDLGRLSRNLQEIRRHVGARVAVIGVVKANAYGHGAARVARELERLGVSTFGVATPQEASELRDAGITGSILIFGCAFPSEVEALLKLKVAVAISDLSLAEALSQAAINVGTRVPIHLKIDTGMGRLGVRCDQAVESAMRLTKMPGLAFEGILTHFPSADEDEPATQEQIEVFERVCAEMLKHGIHASMRHAANTGGMFFHPRAHFNAVRPGISLYGYGVNRCRDFQPVLSLKSRVSLVKRFSPGETIGYGQTYRVKDPMLAAAVPVGYADGLSRMLSNRGQMLVRGARAQIVGRISMDHTMIDVTRIPGVQVGDEVVVYGEQGAERITAEDVADLLGTIPYEVLCAIGRRVPRIYLPAATGDTIIRNQLNRDG